MFADRIRQVMAAVFEMDPIEISTDATPGQIARWDSLRHMNLVLALEEEFGVRFPEEQVEQLVSFELIEFSLKELSANE
jgi:acyl carrier protein